MKQSVDQSLAGLQVIVTRPLKQAQQWQQQLQDLGARVSLVPVLAIEAVADPAAKQSIKNRVLALDEYQKAIFVSQNAVQQAWEWIDQFWPQLPVGIEYFAIGTSTARCLRQHVADHGSQVTSAGQAMNSEELLALPELQQVDGEKILIFRGCGGRPKLAAELQRRDARVDLCELYRRLLPGDAVDNFQALLPVILRRPTSPAASNSAENCVLSVHSGESLENLERVIKQVADDPPAVDRVKALPLLVPGQRVADLARQLGFQQVIAAANATDEAMTAALTTWWLQKH